MALFPKITQDPSRCSLHRESCAAPRAFGTSPGSLRSPSVPAGAVGRAEKSEEGGAELRLPRHSLAARGCCWLRSHVPCQLLRPSHISQISYFPKQQQNTMGGTADDALGGFLCRWKLHCRGLDAALWALPGKMWDSGDERPRFGSHLHPQPCGCPPWGAPGSHCPRQHREQGTPWMGVEK